MGMEISFTYSYLDISSDLKKMNHVMICALIYVLYFGYANPFMFTTGGQLGLYQKVSFILLLIFYCSKLPWSNGTAFDSHTQFKQIAWQ